MKTFLAILIAGVLTGCTGINIQPGAVTVQTITPPPLPVTPAAVVPSKANVLPITSSPIPTTVWVYWHNTNLLNNEYTVLKGTNDLTVPLMLWPTIWEGLAVTNGTAEITSTNSQLFIWAMNQIGE